MLYNQFRTLHASILKIITLVESAKVHSIDTKKIIVIFVTIFNQIDSPLS